MKIYYPLSVTSPPLETSHARSGPIVATRENASNTNATASLCLLFSVPFEIYDFFKRPLLIFRPKLHRPLENTNIVGSLRLSCLPYRHSFVLFGNSISLFSLFSLLSCRYFLLVYWKAYNTVWRVTGLCALVYLSVPKLLNCSSVGFILKTDTWSWVYPANKARAVGVTSFSSYTTHTTTTTHPVTN